MLLVWTPHLMCSWQVCVVRDVSAMQKALAMYAVPGITGALMFLTIAVIRCWESLQCRRICCPPRGPSPSPSARLDALQEDRGSGVEEGDSSSADDDESEGKGSGSRGGGRSDSSEDETVVVRDPFSSLSFRVAGSRRPCSSSVAPLKHDRSEGVGSEFLVDAPVISCGGLLVEPLDSTPPADDCLEQSSSGADAVRGFPPQLPLTGRPPVMIGHCSSTSAASGRMGSSLIPAKTNVRRGSMVVPSECEPSSDEGPIAAAASSTSESPSAPGVSSLAMLPTRALTRRGSAAVTQPEGDTWAQRFTGMFLRSQRERRGSRRASATAVAWGGDTAEEQMQGPTCAIADPPVAVHYLATTDKLKSIRELALAKELPAAVGGGGRMHTRRGSIVHVASARALMYAAATRLGLFAYSSLVHTTLKLLRWVCWCVPCVCCVCVVRVF